MKSCSKNGKAGYGRSSKSKEGLVKILILGAGQVGSTVAESLVGEANDITVVDSDGEKLR
jgi:trk system potassium uptake protein TrkA